MNTMITKRETETEGIRARSEFYLKINNIVEQSPWLADFSSATRVFTERWMQIQQPHDGQNMNNSDLGELLLRGDSADYAEQQLPDTSDGRLRIQPPRNIALNKQKATSERSDTAKLYAPTQQETSTNPEQRSKRMRAAEARHRLELLEEERELQDNLAEFWDPRFDKPHRNRFQYKPTSAHVETVPARRTQEHAVASHNPQERSKQFET